MSGRRFEHAHRVSPPGSTPTQARAFGSLRVRPSRRAGRPGAASLAALGAIAVLAVTLWAWPAGTTPASNAIDGRTGSGAATDARATALPVSAATPAARTMGPHGDIVPRSSDGPDERWLWRSFGPPPLATLTGYRWPMRNGRITNAFGVGRPGSFLVDGVTMHDGIDLSTFCGDRITAAHDGVVLVAGRRHQDFIGWVGDTDAFREKLDAEHGWRGQAIAVVVDDGNGYRSIYVHLARTAVKAGQVVHAGDLLGYEGSTGNSTGCHLHYALFSPLERRTLGLDPKVAKKTRLPGRAVARVDPLLVMPPLEDAGITWGWGAGEPP